MTGGEGDHERVEISEYAQRTLEGIRKDSPTQYARILAAIEYFFQTWIPGGTDPDFVMPFHALGRAVNHKVFRIKERDFLGDWRLIVFFNPHPPRNPMIAELFYYTSQASYDDLLATHNRNVKKLILELRAKKRLR